VNTASGVLGGSYFWSNQKNRPEIYPGQLGGEVVWQGFSVTCTIPVATGTKIGAKWSAINYYEMNNGKPIWTDNLW
jgi:hypothetical protein